MEEIAWIWHDPVWSKVFGTLIATVVIGVFTILYKYRYDKNMLGLNRRRASVFAASFLIAPLLSVSLLSIGTDGLMEALTATVEMQVFAVLALILFLVLVLLLIVVPRYFGRYDLFLSTPMSFSSEEDFVEHRKRCLELIELVKKGCKFKRIYFAAQDIESMAQFNAGSHAVAEDLTALRKSDRFLLYMPKRMPSSAIFEAGFALRKNMPTVYLCHRDGDLPFLMRDLNDSHSRVRKYRAATFSGITTYVKQTGCKLFARSE